MNCAEWEERIAAGEPDPAVERHLAGCTACREFAAEIERSLGMLRAAHAEAIAPAHYAAVRARVWAAVGARRRRLFWRLAMAAAMLVALLYPAVERWRSPEPPVPVRIARRPTAEVPLRMEKRPAVVRAASHPKPRRTAARPEPPRTPLLIKLLTDDPNVVIYWVTE